MAEQVFEKHVLVCTQEKGPGIPSCAAAGAKALLARIQSECGKAGLDERVLVTSSGCLGICDRGPNVAVQPDGRWYTKVSGDDAKEIVEKHLAGGEPLPAERDPAPAALRAEAVAHRAKVRMIMAGRARAGVLPDELDALLRGFQPARALLSALELDLFSAVGDGADAGEIASKIGADPRATELLSNALVALGLLEKSDGRFRNGDWARTWLAAGAPHDARSALRHSSHLWPLWSDLTETVRRGTSSCPDPEGDPGEAWTESFIAAMHRNASARAMPVAGAIDLSGVRRLLDLGGGSGAYSQAFARASAVVAPTVFDFPRVTPLARRYADAAGLSERISTVDGDFRRDDLGADWDLVFVSAVCHMLSPEENRALFGKIRASLAPGGRVAIQDFVLDDDKTSPAHGALFSLNMLVATRSGSSWSGREYHDWLAAAGFAAPRTIALPGPTKLIVAARD